MNLWKKGPSVSPLNPNAAEFVPLSLRASSSGKQLLDPPPDEEVAQYWQHQLPDDITPDFKDALSLSPLSLHSASTTPFFFNPPSPSSTSHATHITPPSSSSSSSSSSSTSHASLITPPSLSSTSHASLITPPSSSSSSTSHATHITPPSSSSTSHATHHHTHAYPSHSTSPTHATHSHPLHFLASHFPGFAAQSLAEVYYANSCDLNLTIDMLTQLELQVDGVFDQNMNSKTLSAPSLTSMDFPALPVPDNKTNLPRFNGDELEQSVSPYRSSDKDNMFLFKTGSSKGASDFASAVRKLASQDSGLWKYDRNSSAEAIVGSSKTSHVLPASYDTSAYIDRMLSRSSSRAAPIWLETGDAVANLYSELREEARDHARLRNTYFEQARQAYLSGNKALAKELSVKGQVHNMQMKAAHHKAQESIYRQRNPISSREGSNEKMIDLHGLHVSEAIHVLRQELGILRNAARMGEQRMHVYICVGTGHHTRGSRTPARLPISVQRYLLEEGLDFTEPQPGLLRVVLY